MVFSKEIDISIASIKVPLKGLLTLPKNAQGLVVFAHGSGSGRHSPRNQYVAQVLNQGSIATLLLDLLTLEEEEIDQITRHIRFDIPLLSERLTQIASYLSKNQETKLLNLGYFGASTGAAAALIAAAKQPELIKAVVSRGGRADLAGSFLSSVKCPTLLIVGGNDFGVIELNQEAYALIKAKKELKIVPEATHLFEEEGALEEVSRLALQWFSIYLENEI